MKTLMAQANGVPIVASDLPALREVTGNNAMFFRAEDPKDLAGTLQDVIDMKPAAIHRQIKIAKEWVKSRTWESNANKLIDLYGK